MLTNFAKTIESLQQKVLETKKLIELETDKEKKTKLHRRNGRLLSLIAIYTRRSIDQEYNKEMYEKMNPLSAREVRRQNMIKLNKSDFMRKLSSETAKKTSARPEIQAARAVQLKNWRDNNRTAFFDKCTRAMIKKSSKSSNTKPEQAIKKILDELSVAYKQTYTIKNKHISNKSKRRLCDFYVYSIKTVIEFDGIRHFESIGKSASKIKEDQELNSIVVNNLKKNIIRLSMSTYDYKTDDIKHEYKQQFIAAIEKCKISTSNCILIGQEYEQYY
jgi:very-short-patch-repair endonuclease